MKLTVENEATKENTEVKIKKKKSKKNGEVKDRSEIVANALKKPRTRSVSLTLSENGINEDLENALPDKKGKKLEVKNKKSKKTGDKKEKKVKATADQSAGDKLEVKENTSQATDDIPPEHAAGRFSNFPIRAQTISKLQAKGMKYLFPVQAQTFVKVIEGQDVIAKARTGTGKTMAFALPLIEKLEAEGTKSTKGRPPRVLVLAPTRELVNQVAKDFKAFSCLSIHAFYGGVPLHEQGTALRNGIDVLVGTPGRLLDWIDRGQLDTSQLEHVVLDEVDQMLDMGFADDVEKIISFSYNRSGGIPNPQTLLFSATLPDWVKRTAQKYMDKMPPVIDLVGSSLNQTATNVTHIAIRSHWNDHATDISKIIQYYSGDNGRAMVFCHTKKDVDVLAMCPEIKQNKEKLHGDVKQKSRESVLEQFRQGKVKVLVTTNVAARGLDIPEVDVVIQTSPPTDIESYIHRSGRTGRAGKSGISICLFTNRTEADLIQVERRAKLTFKRVGVPSVDQLASQGMKDLCSSMEKIDVEVLARFREMANELIEKKGAEDAVAALIALATGQTKNKKVSLINSREGLITLLYTTNATIQFKGYVYHLLQNISYDVKLKVVNMTLTKDSKGAVFDLPLETFQEFESQLIFESDHESLVVATELPELQTNVRSFNPPASQGWKSREGGNGGGRGNSTWGGGAKRSYQQTSDQSVQNKRVKFD